MVRIATDGAAVMMGVKNSMVARIEKELEQPFIQAIHCSAHRLELAYKDVCKKISQSIKFEKLIQALGQTPLMPTRVEGTRWLPHIRQALTNMLGGYQAIIQHLEQVSTFLFSVIFT